MNNTGEFPTASQVIKPADIRKAGMLSGKYIWMKNWTLCGWFGFATGNLINTTWKTWSPYFIRSLLRASISLAIAAKAYAFIRRRAM